MKKLIYPLLALVVLPVSSCKPEVIQIEEDDCVSPDCELYDWEMPSSVGSYWIYEWYLIDSTGASSSLGIYDTVTVVGDTSANGITYAIYQGTHYGTYQSYRSYVRDSSGFVVDINGSVGYSLYGSGEQLSQGSTQMHNYQVLMSDNSQQKNVPAGTFDCFTKDLVWTNLDGSPMNSCGDGSFVEQTFIHPTDGIVAKQLAYLSEIQFCQYREGRLIEYFIAP